MHNVSENILSLSTNNYHYRRFFHKWYQCGSSILKYWLWNLSFGD